MVITLYDFMHMSETDQYEIVWKGTFLGDRHDNGLWIQCYSLGSFYVELFYDQQANQVQRLRPFTRVEQLAPYL
ncbi:hypothetical protein GCM10023313_24760 [Mucilaginibacter defluvii]|uniref:Uncharacterized protein n=1 Tax=Mucilaginibacter defluvii TaxID=1196019 RepID=A0ABP9FXR2_9SPHI